MTKDWNRAGIDRMLLVLAIGMHSTALVAEESPRFNVIGWSIEGNTLLPEDELQAALAPYAKTDASFDTLKEALTALEATYLNAGYSAVRVLLPEQELDGQQVRLKVLEARIGRVFVEGNQYFSSDTIRASVPGLQEGSIPNIKRVSDELQVVNDSPARQQSVILKRGQGPSEVDGIIRVQDADPLSRALLADNSGSRSTGRYRLAAVAQHANLFERDHVGSVQVMTSPDHVDGVTLIGLGYRLPMFETGGSIDLAFGYSDVDSGSVDTAGGTLNLSGRGYTTAARYHQYLPKHGELTQKVSFGIDHRFFENTVADPTSGIDFAPDLAVTPISLAYSLNGRWSDIDFGANLGVARNLAIGSHGRADDFGDTTPARYTLWHYGFSLAQPLTGDWNWRFECAGQQTGDHLIAGEQFGLGGADSVRGFEERAVINDRGYRLSLAITSPEIGQHLNRFLGEKNVRMRGIWFADGGAVSRNHALAGETRSESISSTGLGLRGSLGRSLSFRADLGVVLKPAATEAQGDARLHASMTYLF